MVFAGRHERGAGAILADRPPVAGPRWRPHEESNRHRRPKDFAAYLRQFETRPPGDPYGTALGRLDPMDPMSQRPERSTS
jgi:hypothetical protein